LPHLLYERPVVDREQVGGLAAGGLGALGLATLASGPLELTPSRAGFTALGSGLGAAIGGGLALMAPSLHDRGGVALMLGGGAVDPRDFGWLSLFGALGTVAGAAAGAPFSTRSEPAPVLAGLAAGPAVGMLTGALVLPRLRRLAAPASATSSVRSIALPARVM